MRTPEPKLLYKSQSGGKCAYVYLHPDSFQQSPYMELTTPSFTMHNLICISLPCISHPRDTMFNDVKGPNPVLGVYMTPIDFFLINKNGSLHLSGIKFCDFFYII